MIPWPSQQFAVDQALSLHEQGERRIVICSPTGGGKTFIMVLLIRLWLEQGLTTAIYTNRRSLVRQLSRELYKAGIKHGIRAAGVPKDNDAAVQIVSIQTEAGRAGLKRRKCGNPDCTETLLPDVFICPTCNTVLPSELIFVPNRAIIDEAHMNASQQMRMMASVILDAGGSIFGFTATPLDLGDFYSAMILAGTTSELRSYNPPALVHAQHYGPDEPDFRAMKISCEDKVTERQAVNAIMTGGIFGRVLDWFIKLNPNGLPTLLFAPGVKESLWFAEMMSFPDLRENEADQKLPAFPFAHIDGDEVWIPGQGFLDANDESREEAFRLLKAGDLVGISNRYVLREGIDLPFIRHMIFATVFGGLDTCLQTYGRGLRADNDPETIERFGPKTHVTFQDHGGNYWRHGSANADREWILGATAVQIAGMRAARLRLKKCRHCGAKMGVDQRCTRCGKTSEIEQSRCPECARIIFGKRCPCGFVLPEHRSRMVVQRDGTLAKVDGDAFRAYRVSKTTDTFIDRWRKTYYQAKNSKNRMTFRQAYVWFAKFNKWFWPDAENWPLMPLSLLDEFLPVADVPYARLRPDPKFTDRPAKTTTEPQRGLYD